MAPETAHRVDRHGRWLISEERPPIPIRSHDWQAVDDEDGRTLTAGSREELIRMIEEASREA